ncbi:hypothetical protein ACFSMW_13685 [Virgibacillus halophilus]|uniref:Uncharacterized protein n=1 Tax=Tigheibacillus halophilus TaxID=361280 RepID=A0ABU5C4G7_9BACI|nr:hypothetical protein [Virgibacillus halophilus]
MKVSHFYEKGSKKVNEDVCILNEKAGIFAAIDGATGLDGTPGHIASYAIGEVLRQAEKDMALFSVLKAANEKVQENTLGTIQEK